MASPGTCWGGRRKYGGALLQRPKSPTPLPLNCPPFNPSMFQPDNYWIGEGIKHLHTGISYWPHARHAL